MSNDKNSVNYLTNNIMTRALHNKVEGNVTPLILPAGITTVTADTAPEIRHAGNTVCYITGKLVLGGTISANMLIAEFPDHLKPHNISHAVVTEEKSGTPTTFMLVPIKMASEGITLLLTNPASGAIIHFQTTVYLTRD